MSASLAVTVLSLVVGFISQGVGQGSVLGIVTVPKTWVPYLSIVATYLGGLIEALSSGATTSVAVLAGFQALLGMATGSVLAHHIATPARTLALKPPANENAAGAPPKAAA